MQEIRRILATVTGLDVVSLEEAGIGYLPEEEALEPFETFEENALSKARHFAARSGLPTVADDSGITVDALDGAPGVRSKRFAPDGGAVSYEVDGQALDDANNQYLIERLRDVPPEHRSARYVCVASFVEAADSKPMFFRGEAHGRIVEKPAGSGGFGYDPHVFHEDLGRTYAEMTSTEKDARSHRGAAFRALAAYLSSRAG